jgi:hypothetical protein
MMSCGFLRGFLLLAALSFLYCVLAHNAFPRLILMCYYILAVVAYLTRCWIHGFSLTHFFLAIAPFCVGVDIPLELIFVNPRALLCHG